MRNSSNDNNVCNSVENKSVTTNKPPTNNRNSQNRAAIGYQHRAHNSNNNNQYNNQYYRKRPIICTKCLSRSGTHTAINCKATYWCTNCKNASHQTKDCRNNRK